MTKEEREEAIKQLQGCIIAEEHGKDGKPNGNVTCELTKDILDMAIKALKQEPCDVFDEYGNYKYPSDVELTERNTVTSMPCEDAISRQAAIDAEDSK